MPAKAMQHQTPPHTPQNTQPAGQLNSAWVQAATHTSLHHVQGYSPAHHPAAAVQHTWPVCAGCVAAPQNCGRPCAPAADSAGAAGSPVCAGSMPGGHMGPHMTPPAHMPAPHMGIGMPHGCCCCCCCCWGCGCCCTAGATAVARVGRGVEPCCWPPAGAGAAGTKPGATATLRMGMPQTMPRGSWPCMGGIIMFMFMGIGM
jgi:hypothetical protein